MADLLNADEVSWRQKWRALWLQASNRNITFFYKLANAYRHACCVHFMAIVGKVFQVGEGLNEAIFEFFSKHCCLLFAIDMLFFLDDA